MLPKQNGLSVVLEVGLILRYARKKRILLPSLQQRFLLHHSFGSLMNNDTSSMGVPPPPPPLRAQPKPKRRRWWIPLSILLFLVFLMVGALVGMAYYFGNILAQPKVQVADEVVLHLNGVMSIEETTGDGINLFSDNTSASHLNVLRAIRAAANDDRIKGIYINGAMPAGTVKVVEILNELKKFKASGKPVWGYLEGGTEREYFIASVADSLFVAPYAWVMLDGFGGASPFLKDIFEKAGVEYTVLQFEEYKSAGEIYSRSGYSAPAREAVRRLLEQRQDLFVSEVAGNRKIDAGVIRSVLARGVVDGDSLRMMKFFDEVATEGSVRRRFLTHLNIEEEDEDNERFLSLSDYIGSDALDLAVDTSAVSSDAEIALINASGPIVSDAPSGSPFGGGEQVISSKSLVALLRKARLDDAIQAVILRIDSPGGSVIASEEIREEILALRQEKPVYASMSDYAASGGYYIAMDCDTIIAHPETVTGSIGVIMAIPNVSKAAQKLGIGIDTVVTSPSAAFLEPGLPINQADVAKLRASGERTYRDFVGRAAKARGKEFEQLRAVAKGRVWSGRDARARGLVDVLGGLDQALAIAKRRLGVDSATNVRLHVWPEKKDPFEVFLKRLAKNTASEMVQIINHEVRSDATALAAGAIEELVPEDMKRQLLHARNTAILSRREGMLMMLPQLVPGDR